MHEYMQMIDLLEAQQIPYNLSEDSSWDVIEVGNTEFRYRGGRFVEVAAVDGCSWTKPREK